MIKLNKKVQEETKVQGKVKRKWYKKKRFWITGLVLVWFATAPEIEEYVSDLQEMSPNVEEVEIVEQELGEEEITETEEIIEEPTAQVTREMENAFRSGQGYLRFMAFSKSGLADQLAFEGFPTDAIEWAMEQIDAKTDWYAQAVESAESFLSFSSFSRQSLQQQLEFGGFTTSQAQHAVDTVF